MLKTQYVTDHEKKVVKAKRGLFGYLRVFLAFAVLNGIISISAEVVIVVPVTIDCLSNSSRSEAECYANARNLKRGTNLLALVGASALVANKLNKDALKRYEDLEERT